MSLDQDIIVKKHNKRLIVFPHTGMGDHLIVYGAIRQLSQEYDEIKIVVLDLFLESVQFLYRDDTRITFLPIKNIYEFSPNYRYHFEFGTNSDNVNIDRINKYNELGYIYMGCYMHKLNFDGNYNTPKPFYEIFYQDLGLDYNSTRWKFSLNRDIEREKKFYNQIAPKNKYIFIHDNIESNCSRITAKINIISELEIFHPNKAAQISNIILDYGYIIENAEELYILDSSFYSLCNYLDLSKIKKKTVFTRPTNTYLNYLKTDIGWEVKKVE